VHYNHAVKWLKSFRHSPEAICAMYADDFLFEDVMLDQRGITDKGDLHRLFVPYANTDPDNGVGIHNFRIRSYIGTPRRGLIRWEWSPKHAGVFLGVDVAGKPFSTQGHTWHEYDENGLITRESSWWDAAAVFRQTGPVHPTTSLTGTKGTATASADGAGPAGFAPANGMEHASRWCAALGGDVDALGTLYADWFTLEDTFVEDHLVDTVTDRTMLAEKFGAMAAGENGTYTFTPTEYLAGDGPYGLIHWTVSVEDATTFRGIPTGGRTVTTIGSTFHQFDEQGKIVLESTHWEDNQALVQLGIPIGRPHYWEEGFDPTAG
jgi:steroid delta-isomerase-like uncharacterized protein